MANPRNCRFKNKPSVLVDAIFINRQSILMTSQKMCKMASGYKINRAIRDTWYNCKAASLGFVASSVKILPIKVREPAAIHRTNPRLATLCL